MKSIIAGLLTRLGLSLAAFFTITCVSSGEETRTSISLNSDWRFQFNDQAEFKKVKLNQVAKWENVSIPHTWNNLDGQDGGGNYRAGIGWYYREFKAVADNKNVYLRFEAANRDTEVYLNDKLVGKHEGGYSAFVFKINDYLSPSGINKLAVKVRNYERMQANSLPNRADYTFFGGIYRDVSLVYTNKVHISTDDYASLGSYVKQKKVSPESAELEIKTLLKNDTTEQQAVQVKVTVLNDRGETVASTSGDYQLSPTAGDTAMQTLLINQPHLWQGVEDPYLYTVHTDLYRENQLVDRVTQRLGLRFFSVDPNKGFFLNGKHLKLHGVNRHQDRLDKGWAISNEDIAEDIQIMLEMGVNSIRASHYQHAQRFFELCDEKGIILYAEIPFVDFMQDNEHYFENARQQMTELIRQNFHHSSVIFWGIGNETKESSNGTPSIKLLRELQPLAKKEDDSRLTNYAHNGTPNDEKIFVADVSGWNRYAGWYSGEAPSIAKTIDDFHQKNPKRAFSLTEYGAGGSIVQHTDNYTTRPDPRGPFHPEEYQSYYHEVYLKIIMDREWVFASWLWNMFDFAADHRDEGDTPGRNDKGLVTYDRKTKKDVFYLYKANWSKEPFCYLTSKRYTKRQSASTLIKVYSNCDEVEAFLDGKSLGKKKGAYGIFTWEGIQLGRGENRVNVRGTHDGKTYEDQAVWLFEGKAAEPQATGKSKAKAGASATRSKDQGAISASVSQAGHDSKHAYDKNPETRWAAKGLKEWIQVDFDAKKRITGFKVQFHKSDSRQYTIDIEVSEDGPFWEKVVADGKSTPGSNDYAVFKFAKPVTVQYLRVINKGNSQNDWISITEMEPLVD